MSRLTALFTKRPEPGKVKTRLCPPLEPASAAALARAMLDDLVERHAAGGGEFVLVVSPAEDRAWFEERYSVPVHVQRGADLGERLANWFEEALADHISAVVIGGDLPQLSRATVQEAYEELEGDLDAVFAPDYGGGYGLVGLRRGLPELFTRVPMSTDHMLQDTLAVALAAGLAADCIAPVLDVDRSEDLERLARELDLAEGLVPDSEFPSRTHSLLETLLPPL